MGELSTLPPQQPLSADRVRRVLERLSGKYGSKFADLWRDINPDLVHREWSLGLAGYSDTEIIKGLEECNKYDWPPTLPEFIKRCRPALDAEAAFYEACTMMPMRHSTIDSVRSQATFSHPAIFWAAADLGTDLLSLGYDKARVRWKLALNQAYQRCYEIGGQYATVPEPPKLIEHQKVVMSKEEASERYRKIMAQLGD